MTGDRLRALLSVINLDGPVDEVVRRLRSFPWDSDSVLAVIEPKTVLSLLDRYLEGTLTAKELEDWADAVEGRDDVGYSAAYEEVLRQVVFELANPLLTQPVSPERVRFWKNALESIDLPGG